ncbi:MAG: DUF4416 family protein [candidate division Zixibacteria bacterium]|nr:DUF4416 family protein [candidate division Zixibacteria bacterium]
MSIQNPPRVKLICAVTFAPRIKLDDIMFSLERAFGMVDSKSPVIAFDHTDYYQAEMGPDLKKTILSFDYAFKPEDLWIAKRTAIDIESVFAKDGKRGINLDPGYLETSKLVLASTKNFSHRVYLNEGIYAEITLIFADGKFQKLPWTYPDYLDKNIFDFLTKTREGLKNNLR